MIWIHHIKNRWSNSQMYFIIIAITLGVLCLQTSKAQNKAEGNNKKDLATNTSKSEATKKMEAGLKLGKSKDYEASLTLLLQAADLFLAEKNNASWFRCVKSIRSIYFKRLQQYPETLNYLVTTLAQAEQQLGATNDTTARILSYIGIAHSKMGNFDKALVNYEKALQIFEQNPSTGFTASVYKNTGNIYMRRMDYTKAVDYLTKALNIEKQLQNQHKLVPLYSDLSNAYHFLGNYEEEVAQYNAALALPNIAPYEKALILLNKAGADIDNGQAAKGLVSCEKVLPLLQDDLPDVGEFKVTVNEVMGKAYLAFADTLKGTQHLEKAVVLAQEVYGNKHRELARIYLDLSRIKDGEDDWQAALNLAQKALVSSIPSFNEIAIGQNPALNQLSVEPFIMTALATKGDFWSSAYLQTNNQQHLEQALAAYLLALKQTQILRFTYTAQESKLFLGNFIYDIYEIAIQTSWQLYGLTKDKTYLSQVFDLMESSKATVLLEGIKEIEAQRLASIPDSLTNKLRSFKGNIYALTKKVNQKQLPDSLAKIYQDSLFSLKRQQEEVMHFLEQNFPDYQDLKYDIQHHSLAQTQAFLPSDAMMIAYFVGSKQLFSVSLTATNATIHQMPFPTDSINTFNQDLQQLRQALANTNFIEANPQQAFSHYTQQGYYFYTQLIEQQTANFKGKELIIIPDGQLGYVPFEALLTEEVQSKKRNYKKLPYLLQQYAVSYAYSATLLAKSSQANTIDKSNGEMLAFAPFATFQQNLSMQQEKKTSTKRGIDSILYQLAPLKNTQNELTELQQIVKGQYYLGEDAHKHIFNTEAQQANMLHLATHTIIDNENPMQSVLAFSPQQNDPYLRAYELYNMQLNAKMTVLSACETGYGKLSRGEGIMSLSRAFTHAGCPSIIMTLWKVDDRATSTIMIDFYKQLALGMRKQKALKNAKLNYLNNTDLPTAHPYYWIGLLSIGNQEEIDLGNSFFAKHLRSVLLLLAIISMVLLILFFRKKKVSSISN